MKLKHFLLISGCLCTFYVVLKLPFFEDSNYESLYQNIVDSTSVDHITASEDPQIEKTSSSEMEFKGWKKILLWTDFLDSQHTWTQVFRRVYQRKCGEHKCRFTLNRMAILNVDAVIFNAYNLRNMKGLDFSMEEHVIPLPFQITRTPEQVYIFYSMEPPTKMDASYLAAMPKNYFNWTMGYRRDSDVYEPFGMVNKQSFKAIVSPATQNRLIRKKFAIWIGSSCNKNTTYLRDGVLRSLKRKIKIDIFGDCGIRCDDDASGTKIYGKDIGDQTCELKIQNYVFYLALENSLCRDYITEKIFKAWQLGAIPVVFGAGNYKEFAPPNSYIDYRDFDSISDLAEYMKKVARDSHLYDQYFKWREDYDIDIGSPYEPHVCDLCKKLHQHSTHRESKWYSDIYDWFVRRGNCKSSENF